VPPGVPQVPSYLKYFVVPVPIVMELFSIFPLLEESANNKLSPFPKATAVEVIVPVFKIFP